jgi:SPW repeat
MGMRHLLKAHRTWEDYLGLALAVAIGLSPWFQEEFLPGRVYTNAAVLGVILLLLAQFEFIRTRRSEEIAELACGAWLLVSPFLLGYAAAGTLRYWHWVLGVAVIALAALEYWQGGDVAIEDRE